MWVFVLAMTISMILGWLIAPFYPSSIITTTLFKIGELSAIAFAVIGVWLSLSYRDEIITNMWHKCDSPDEQKEAARLVIVAHARCQRLFRGLVVTLVVLIGAYALAIVLPVAKAHISTWNETLLCVSRRLLVGVTILLALAQTYSLLICIAPMVDIIKELREAKKNAERIRNQ